MTEDTIQRQDEASARLTGRMLTGLAGAAVLNLLLSLRSALNGGAGMAIDRKSGV